MRRIACIHTVYSVIAAFTEELKQALPEDTLIHTIYDDFLATDPARTGCFSETNLERFGNDLKNAELTGAELIVVSCSTLSPAVRRLRNTVKVPVVAIDDAMIREGVALGVRIGLMATAESTVAPSSSAVKAAAEEAGKDIDLKVLCRPEAIRALNAGDRETHDRILLEMAEEMKDRDVILLAQASMAHMEKEVEKASAVRTLSSPERCIAEVCRRLGMQ